MSRDCWRVVAIAVVNFLAAVNLGLPSAQGDYRNVIECPLTTADSTESLQPPAESAT